jgi:hypothetical protein
VTSWSENVPLWQKIARIDLRSHPHSQQTTLSISPLQRALKCTNTESSTSADFWHTFGISTYNLESSMFTGYCRTCLSDERPSRQPRILTNEREVTSPSQILLVFIRIEVDDEIQGSRWLCYESRTRDSYLAIRENTATGKALVARAPKRRSQHLLYFQQETGRRIKLNYDVTLRSI